MLEKCEVRGLEILLNVESKIEKYRAETYSGKEPETLEWIDRFFATGEVFYDIGANIGQYSLYAAKRHPGLMVYAFEPEALSFSKLNKNIMHNGLSGQIMPCCAAICDKLSFKSFNIHPYAAQTLEQGDYLPGAAMHSFGEAVDYKGESFTPLHRQATVGVSLDCLVFELGAPKPNHIKIDVDGLEEEICQGMRKTVRDAALRSVLVEISLQAGPKDPVYALFNSLGFRQVDDFADHSSRTLKGTPYEDSYNTVFVRD